MQPILLVVTLLLSIVSSHGNNTHETLTQTPSMISAQDRCRYDNSSELGLLRRDIELDSRARYFPKCLLSFHYFSESRDHYSDRNKIMRGWQSKGLHSYNR